MTPPPPAIAPLLRLASAVLLVLSAAAARAGAADVWPAFRGAGDSRSDAKDLPLNWSDDRGVAWRVPIPGYGQSSPVVWRDRAFVTSVEGESKDELVVTCLALTDGRVRWQQRRPTGQRVKSTNYISKAAPTPAVNAGRVCAFFESGDLLAFDHDGNPLWARSLLKEYGPFANNHGLGTSPAWCGGKLVLLVAHGPKSYLLAVDPATGKNAWKTDADLGASWTSPTVVPGGGDGKDATILVSAAGTVAAFAGRDGAPLWRADGYKGNTVASPSVAGDLAVIGAGDTGAVFAVRLAGPAAGKGEGEVDAGAAATAWRAADVNCSFGSPLVHDGRAYFTNKVGVAHCLDARTGQVVWKERLAANTWASPLGAPGRVYFFSTDGTCAVYATGATKERLAENRLTVKGKVYGVAAVDGAILVRAGEELVCVRAVPSP